MRRAGYASARSLGLALGMSDGSLVSKWLNGNVRRIESERHLRELPRILRTPEDYFRNGRTTADRLAEVERRLAEVEAEFGKAVPRLRALRALIRRVDDLEARVQRGTQQEGR